MSEMLRNIISDGLSAIPGSPLRAELNDLRPPPSGATPTVAVFLYEVVEDPTLRNRGRITKQQPSANQPGSREYSSTKSSLALILRYLVVPYGGDRETEYEMLGRTLQALHQQSIRSMPSLSASLRPMEACSISLAPLSLEERTRVWWSISQPYRLSLNYEVRVVEIDVDPDDLMQPTLDRSFGFQLDEVLT